MSRTVMWFRRDLRLRANAALAAAAADGEVVPLFVIDPAFARAGAPRQAFMADALSALDKSMGDSLVYRRGDPADVVPAFARELDASSVVAAADFGPYGSRRDNDVERRLASDGRSFRRVGSPYAVNPGTVTKDDGSPYSVFTPFFKKWQTYLDRSCAETPIDVRWHGAPYVPCDGPPPRVDTGCELPVATEESALDLLDAFEATGGFDGYVEHRDEPSVAGTSRLSPYLRWGLLHPDQVLERLGESHSHAVFRSELCWREFYADILRRRPDTAWRNLQHAMDSMPVDTDDTARERFARWAGGQTGYPIVDAGMRQLATSGWMHNRVRMIAASFLVKDLHLPWQWGAKHFMGHLVDGDLASNNHGWQWVAGSGTDAAPYFRIFNPVSQSERFDPGGEYIRRWVPELGDLSSKAVHAPWRANGTVPLGYVAPLVDHAVERTEALRRYALCRATLDAPS
jgi:deoxyribodipyrimidine photo-lyase